MLTHTSFGQPMGGICQVAYVVEDLHQGMRDFSEKFDMGPWFYSDEYKLQTAKYRGKPTDMKMGLALAFSGHMCFELITPDDKPSVYRDVIDVRGYGYHHLGYATVTFDKDVERYSKMGYELAFEGSTPRGIRFAYFDTTRDMPGMLELIEFNETQNKFLKLMQDASINWDGKEPARKLESLLPLLK
jgi:hypothetical protein